MYEFLEQNQIVFFISLGLVTFGLAVYLGMLVKSLYAQKEQMNEHEHKLQETAEYYKESILIISKSTIQGQCEVSEACIRIKKLLEFFPEIEHLEQFSVIQKMYNELKSFAYLQERKELTRQEVFKQDNARFQVEEKYQDKFVKSLRSLVEKFETLT